MTQRNDLSVGLIQAATVWHDADANRVLYGEAARRAAPGRDLLVLPETLLSGFSNDVQGQAETMDGPGVAWFRSLATEVGCVLTGSFVIRAGDVVYNRLLWACPDGRLETYDKRHLFRMAGEHERYGGGNQRRVFELKGWRICPQVCYDLRFPVWLRNAYDRAAQRFDYDLLLFVANWPAARRHAWRTLLKARAIENLAYVAGVNRVGTDGNQLHYAGDSAVLDFLGQPLVECGPQAMSAGATLSAQALADHRARFPAWMDADDFALV